MSKKVIGLVILGIVLVACGNRQSETVEIEGTMKKKYPVESLDSNFRLTWEEWVEIYVESRKEGLLISPPSYLTKDSVYHNETID